MNVKILGGGGRGISPPYVKLHPKYKYCGKEAEFSPNTVYMPTLAGKSDIGALV